jgi:uncharacterized protein (TIGR02266 family)
MTCGMSEESRVHPRYDVNAFVDVTTDDAIIYHRIQNISVGGICIQTAALSDVGTLVDVVINFPELNQQVSLRGQVVWTNREPPGDVGIRWVGIDAERRDQLRQYIDRVRTREAASPQ